jgi:hypothetical protein
MFLDRYANESVREALTNVHRILGSRWFESERVLTRILPKVDSEPRVRSMLWRDLLRAAMLGNYASYDQRRSTLGNVFGCLAAASHCGIMLRALIMCRLRHEQHPVLLADLVADLHQVLRLPHNLLHSEIGHLVDLGWLAELLDGEQKKIQCTRRGHYVMDELAWDPHYLMLCAGDVCLTRERFDAVSPFATSLADRCGNLRQLVDEVTNAELWMLQQLETGGLRQFCRAFGTESFSARMQGALRDWSRPQHSSAQHKSESVDGAELELDGDQDGAPLQITHAHMKQALRLNPAQALLNRYKQ